MTLHKLFLTENACYKAGVKIKVKGIMVHSTAANNPYLKRYIGPDDGLLGKNKYGNHWNTYHPGGKEKCVHAFIGKLEDGSIATYQTLPWEVRGWHAGGKANDTHIGFEICEDALTDPVYFSAVYNEAVELCVYLCKMFGLSEKDIICHAEGHAMGIASNHGDVNHWFPKHGKSMDTFRADVRSRLVQAPGKPNADIIKTGDLVKITGKTYYSGKTIPGWVLAKNWYVHSVKGDRAVINESEDGQNAIMSPVKVSDLRHAGEQELPAYRIHTVSKGETLWGISRTYLGAGARYPEIMLLNGMNNATVYTGMQLIIPN